MAGAREWFLLKRYLGRFPNNFGKFLSGILGISVWEESVPFVTSPICLQAPLRRFTKEPDALVTVLLFSRRGLCSSLSRQTNAYYQNVLL